MVPPFKPNISGEFGLDNFDAQFTNEPIQLTPDDEWVPVPLKTISHCQPSTIKCKQNNHSSPASVAATWSRRSTSLSSRASSTSTRSSCRQRSACEELDDVNANTNHARTHTQTYIRTYTHSCTRDMASLSRQAVRRGDNVTTLTCFEDSSCTVERLFAKISLTLSHL